MAAVDITISGILYDKINRTTQNVVLIGEATLTGLGVGGGPIQPPTNQPPGIWGPTDPRPTPPIPIYPGGTPNPPTIGGGPIIPPTDPPPIDPNNPPVQWKPLWTPEQGWVVVGVVNPDIPHPTPS